MKTRVPSFAEWILESDKSSDLATHQLDITDLNEAVNETYNEDCKGEPVSVKSPHSGKVTKASPCMLSALIKKGWKQTDDEE